jgi:hypothetical protein
MITDPLFYALAIPAVILVGLSKGGFAGVGALGTPLLAQVISPVKAAAILLPILILQDSVGVWAFRREWSGRVLALMLPSAAAGIFLGYVLALHVTGDAVSLAVGLISIAFGFYQLRSMSLVATVKPPPAWIGVLCGVGSGFASQISHAGGPPFQIYALPLRLSRDVFIGTSAIYFAVVNWIKVPAYVALGQFTRESLWTSLALLPLALASTLAGVWMVRRVRAERFFRIVCVLLIVVGIRLAWTGMTGAQQHVPVR